MNKFFYLKDSKLRLTRQKTNIILFCSNHKLVSNFQILSEFFKHSLLCELSF
jgi:hypothetical protein